MWWINGEKKTYLTCLFVVSFEWISLIVWVIPTNQSVTAYIGSYTLLIFDLKPFGCVWNQNEKLSSFQRQLENVIYEYKKCPDLISVL